MLLGLPLERLALVSTFAEKRISGELGRACAGEFRGSQCARTAPPPWGRVGAAGGLGSSFTTCEQSSQALDEERFTERKF